VVWYGYFLELLNADGRQITVPEECSTTAYVITKCMVLETKKRHTQDGVIEGNTALQLVSLCDFRLVWQKQPHLTPQHCELNARQHGQIGHEYWLAGDA